MNHVPTTNGSLHAGRLGLRRPRILACAFACGPELGSEPGIGWWRVVEIARYANVWALVDENDWQQRISAYLAQHGPIPNLKFVFVPRPRWEVVAEFMPLVKYMAYRRWLRRAYQAADRLHRQINFDIAHQITFTSFREPGYLHRLGIPFVWGPVGGAQNYPWRFLLGARFATACGESTRNLLNTLQLHGSRRVRVAARSAAAIFTSNTENQRLLRSLVGAESTVLCDVGIPTFSCESPAARSDGEPLRIVWAGVHTARKSLELLIEALAMLPSNVRYELRVLGEGPLRRSWQKLAERRRIAANVHWLGQVSHDEALRHFRWSDVLAFTSLRDTTGTVVLEALGNGKPVICLDHQGAGEIVTTECGIKIPVTNRREVERRLCDAIALLYRDHRQRAALGQAARRRAAEYLWSRQACCIAQEYNRILESAGSDARCDLGNPFHSSDHLSRSTVPDKHLALLGSSTV
jgi:glycosyltransferase involved in cell wall biosynthesis